MTEASHETRIRTARNHLLGLWAARLLKLDGTDALTYAHELIDQDAGDGELGLIERIMHDLSHAGVDIPRQSVEHMLKGYEAEARRQMTMQ